MSLMSNQPLGRGAGIRNRGYKPNQVILRAESQKDAWSKERDVRLEITATYSGGTFHKIHVTSDEFMKTVAGELNRRCTG